MRAHHRHDAAHINGMRAHQRAACAHTHAHRVRAQVVSTIMHKLELKSGLKYMGLEDDYILGVGGLQGVAEVFKCALFFLSL